MARKPPRKPTKKARATPDPAFGFDYSQDALNEIQRFFTSAHRIIVPLTVKDILDEEIARKLA